MPSDVSVRDLEKIFSRFPRQTIAGTLQVAGFVNESTITVEYVSPRGVVPNFSQAGATQYIGALVEWVTGPLSGLNPPQSQVTTLDLTTVLERPSVVTPSTAPNTNGQGRVTSQIRALSSTGTPIVTTMQFVDTLPCAPNVGDQFIVYQPPQPTIKVSSGTINIAGPVDTVITQANINLPVTGSVEISAGTVDAQITNATIDLPITGTVAIAAGVIDANITKATIDLPITGSVEISAGTLDANITNAYLPVSGSIQINNAYIPVSGSVEISAGTVDATIKNAYLPVSGNVTITGGTLDAHITEAAIDLPITGSVAIAAGTVDANITNATIDVAGSVGTDIGEGFTRLGGGGVVFANQGAINTITFTDIATGANKQAQQIYLQNRGTADIQAWGDEDGSATSVPTNAVVLSPGDALGIAWKTNHIYVSASAAQIGVQVQAWG